MCFIQVYAPTHSLSKGVLKHYFNVRNDVNEFQASGLFIYFHFASRKYKCI